MRPSALYHPPNAFVISASLDEQTLSKLKELEEATGFSRSKMIRTMIMSTNLKAKAMHAEPELVDSLSASA